MKTKGAKICLGLLLLASWVLLVSNVSFAADNDQFGGPGMRADYDKDKDRGEPNLLSNLSKPPEQLPQHMSFYDGRNRDQNNRGNHNGWDKDKHHHQHPSACR